MDELEWIELQAVLDFFAAAPPELARELDLAVLRLGDGASFSIGAHPEMALFNRVLGVDDATRLPELEEWFGSRGCAFVVSATPGSPPEAELRNRGYNPGEKLLKFKRDAAPPRSEAPTTLRIERLQAQQAGAFGAAVAAAFGMPPPADQWFGALCGRPSWGCFGGLADDRLVSTAIAYVNGGLSWLGAAITLPEARGRGGQSALLAARIRWGAAEGADHLTLETRDHSEGEAGTSFRNAQRAGFEPAYRQQWWSRP